MKLYKTCLTGLQVAASPADIIAAFNELPLPVQLRAAGGTMDRLCLREGWDTCFFGPLGIRNIADEVEREDAEKAQADSRIEQLAAAAYMASGGIWQECANKEQWRTIAHALDEQGYRKQANDE